MAKKSRPADWEIQQTLDATSKSEDIFAVTKKVAQAVGAENYNILQNNGRLAHQEVDHVHFHMIPKPDQEQGLGVGWPAQKTDMDGLKKLLEEVKAKM